MSEFGDYTPADWSGHDFDDARKAYDVHVNRSYSDAKASTNLVKKETICESRIASNCTNPLIIFVDVTGSMGEWPATMFSKLPYLEHEAKEYLGADTEICFGAVGDAYSDSYPLQVRPFDKGEALKQRMLELIIEGNGGGQMSETYELAALYALHNVDIPNAIKPVLIMIGDEKPYPVVSQDMAKSVAGVSIEGTITAEQIFSSLMRKYDVYLIRKPYNRSNGDQESLQDREIRGRWVELLGADHICDLPDPARVVDVIFGILAKVANKWEEFKEEIEGRQRDDQVKTVYKSLATIHSPSAKAKGNAGKSIMHLPDGTKTRRLLGP